MRGKEYLPAISLDTCRITPAYAGKSQFGRSIQFQSKDHPRLCGEKHIKQSFLDLLCRITPAYAGKRVDSTFSLLIVMGSPPPMRGKATVIIP